MSDFNIELDTEQWIKNKTRKARNGIFEDLLKKFLPEYAKVLSCDGVVIKPRNYYEDNIYVATFYKNYKLTRIKERFLRKPISTTTHEKKQIETLEIFKVDYPKISIHITTKSPTLASSLCEELRHFCNDNHYVDNIPPIIVRLI